MSEFIRHLKNLVRCDDEAASIDRPAARPTAGGPDVQPICSQSLSFPVAAPPANFGFVILQDLKP